MLTVQYRMHPQISAYPSAQFYGARIENDPAISADRSEARPLLHDILPPYQFVHVEGREERDGTSLCNRAEVAFIAATVKHLTASLGQDRGSVGVITPYSSQKHLHLPLSCAAS